MAIASSDGYLSNLNSLDKEISNLEAKINLNIKNIQNTMSNIYNSTNKGLLGVKTGRQLTGTNDDLFLDPYYDKDGNPTFFINQFCPIFANFARKLSGDNRLSTNGCGPSSWANSFIAQFHVHSLVDSIGILTYCMSTYDHDTKKFRNTLTGNFPDYNNSIKYGDSYAYILKYVTDENGNPKCTKLESNVVETIMNKVDTREGGTFIFGGTSYEDYDKIKEYAESHGCKVEINLGACQLGKSDSILGSSGSSGHYGALSYSTDDGFAVLDSYGQRSFSYERQEGITDPGWGGYNYNEGTNNGKGKIRFVEPVKTNEQGNPRLWHDTTVRIGTDYDTFTSMQKVIRGVGVTYITITPKK